jgi:hypothetical protein
MSSSLRKVKRAQDITRRKAAEKAMKFMERAVNNIPKTCSICNMPFDPKVPGALDTWHVSLSQDSTSMICPTCWVQRGIVQQTNQK